MQWKILALLFLIIPTACWKQEPKQQVYLEVPITTKKDDLPIDEETAPLPPIYFHFDTSKTPYTFFPPTLYRVLEERVQPIAGLDSITINMEVVKSSKKNIVAEYTTNAAWWATLYRANFQGDKAPEYVGVIYPNENIWGSHYTVFFFDNKGQIIGSQKEKDTFLEARMTKRKGKTTLEVTFEEDLTSANLYDGSSYWSLQKDSILYQRELLSTRLYYE